MPRFITKNKKSIGTVPGTLDFIGQQKVADTSLSVICYNAEKLSETNELQSIIQNYKTDTNTIFWVNVYGLHDIDRIKEIANAFSIETITTEDILNTNHIPKYEEWEKYKCFILKLPVYNRNVTSEQISIIVLNNVIITFQEKPSGLFAPLRDRIKTSKGRIRKRKADYLLFAVLDVIIDNYLFSISEIGQEIENTGKLIFDTNEKNIEKRLYRLKTEIGFLRMQVRPVKELIYRFMKSEPSGIEKQNKSFFNDLLELCTQANESVELYNTIIADQISTYNTIVANKMNQVMKVLTVFASIFIPLTFIAGVYGMNFEYIPELKLKYGYFYFWTIIVCAGAVLVYFFRKKKWL